jgi:hypothetical protein
MFKLALTAAALALAGCAVYAAAPSRQDAVSSAEQRALQEGRTLGNPVSCVTSRDIQDTDAISDRVVLFHMKNGRTYRNDLPHSCPQLTRSGSAFAYQTPSSQLCAIDIIRVSEPTSGFGYGACTLGKFTRYELPEGLNRNSF